ncbi:MAG TPA: hypothetical protein PJ982_16725 [Lacipirellulaceae bacterium]|nr:hypothetical protein [Lacipirellulaceae bacterium]
MIPSKPGSDARLTFYTTCALVLVATNAVAQHSGPMMLDPARLAHHVERFNAADEEDVVNLVPNSEAWDWIVAQAPLWECPAGQFEEIYYFRWWTYRKHIKQTPAGRVLTRFILPGSHPGPHNTVGCAVGHLHFSLF